MIEEVDEQSLDTLNPSPEATDLELEMSVAPEIVPTSEHVLNESAPEPVYNPDPIEVPQVADDFWESTSVPKLNNYVPRGTNLPETDLNGSVFMANFQNENTIGSFMSRRSSRDIANVDPQVFNVFDHLTPDQIPDFTHYALDMSQEQIDETTAILALERKNDAIMAAHPWQTLGVGLLTAPLDPVNYLPFGVIYKRAKTAMSVGRAFAGASMSAVASSTVQESILHNNQLTREVGESVWNVTASALLGGALGVGAHRLGPEYKIGKIEEARARKDIMDILIDETPGGSVGASKVSLEGYELASVPNWYKKLLKLAPGARLAASDFKQANKFHSLFLENSYIIKANLEGGTVGPAVETLMKKRLGNASGKAVEYYNEYYRSIGIEPGNFGTVTKLRAAITNNIEKPEMSADQFGQRVAKVLFTLEPDTNKYVNNAAKYLEEALEFDAKPLREMGLLPEEKGTKTSAGYLTAIPNKQKILEQGGRNAWGAGTYPQAIFDGMKRTQESAELFRQSDFYKANQTQIKSLKKQLKTAAKGERKALREQIKELQDDFKTKALEFNKKILDGDGKLWKKLDDDALHSAAISVVDKQLGMEGDKIFNPILDSFNNRKQLKSRTLMVDQADLHEWHIQDPVKIVMLHSRALTPIIELEQFARRMGYKDFEDMKKGIANDLQEEYNEKSVDKIINPETGLTEFKPKTGKDAAKLAKEFRRVKEDIAATLDMIQGIYGKSDANVTSTGWAKFFDHFRHYNALTMLGNITPASFADVGLVALRNGLFNTIYHGLTPMLTDMKKLSKRDLKSLNYGLQSELGQRIHMYMDQQTLSNSSGFFTKASDALTQAFGDVTLFNQWSSGVERLTMNTSINHSLDTIHRIIEGKNVRKTDRIRLAQLGLNEQYFKYIYDKTNTPDHVYNGTRVADWTEWNPQNSFEAQALNDFQAATLKDIDQTIIKPGFGDLPLFARTPFGRTVLQFKAFMFAFTNKVLMPGVQRRKDVETYTGFASMLAMGAMTYVTTKLSRGEEPDLSFGNLAKEAIDRSGVLGVLMEAIDIGQALSIIPGTGVSRYKSRGINGAVFGPSFGRMNDIASLVQNFALAGWGDRDLTTTDMNKLLKLLPLGNTAGMVNLNNALTTIVGDTFNLEETREGY